MVHPRAAHRSAPRFRCAEHLDLPQDQPANQKTWTPSDRGASCDRERPRSSSRQEAGGAGAGWMKFRSPSAALNDRAQSAAYGRPGAGELDPQSAWRQNLAIGTRSGKPVRGRRVRRGGTRIRSRTAAALPGDQLLMRRGFSKRWTAGTGSVMPYTGAPSAMAAAAAALDSVPDQAAIAGATSASAAHAMRGRNASRSESPSAPHAGGSNIRAPAASAITRTVCGRPRTTEVRVAPLRSARPP